MNRCSACPRVNNCVPASGPMVKGGIMFIGEAPGKDEDKRGVPFIGKTGMEVDRHYLPLAGLSREDSYFTNAIKCLPDATSGRLEMSSEADKALALSCAQTHLYEEIAEMEPSLLVTMGAFACFVIDPSINLDLHHGLPLSTAIGIDAFPMWHPAGGIHEPKKMLQIRNDWIRLKRFMRGSLIIPEDQYPNPDYAEVTKASEIYDLDPTRPMANDTEYSRSLGPFCITYCQQPGKARLIRFSRPDLLVAYQEVLDAWESDIWFHNWPYDANVVREGGLRYPRRRIRDTMLRIAHLANLQQGLKPLAFRELGIQMQDFEDLVKPYSTAVVLDYYFRANMEKWPKPEPYDYRDEKDGGKWKVKKPQGMNTKLKRFFTDLGKNPAKDVFGIWDNWQTDLIESVMGPWPGMDILHAAEANWQAVVDYACRDALATLGLVPIIEQMVAVAHSGKAQEMWRA